MLPETYMKYRIVIFLTIAMAFSFSCRNTMKLSNTNISFQDEADGQVNENMPGILVSVISQEKNIDWCGGSGYSDIEKKVKIANSQTFRIASVTKTFVAATILRLYEDGKINIEDPIEKYICKEHADLLKEGGYDPGDITVLHLLSHSGGLSEHTVTEKYQIDFIKTNHVWTRTEQISDLVKYTKPVGKAGKQFSYSDSGYILLGEIIETVTGKSLGNAITEQLKLKELGLNSIHIENAAGEFNDIRIHQYLENEDTYFINPTLDLYGGGGLLSNSRDLCLFYTYLFENRIFSNKSTLDKMLTKIEYSSEQPMDYRLGIWKTEIKGMDAYTHTGFWGTQVIYIPEIKTCIAVNYSKRWKEKGIAPVIPDIVEKIVKK